MRVFLSLINNEEVFLEKFNITDADFELTFFDDNGNRISGGSYGANKKEQLDIFKSLKHNSNRHSFAHYQFTINRYWDLASFDDLGNFVLFLIQSKKLSNVYVLHRLLNINGLKVIEVFINRVNRETLLFEKSSSVYKSYFHLFHSKNSPLINQFIKKETDTLHSFYFKSFDDINFENKCIRTKHELRFGYFLCQVQYLSLSQMIFLFDFINDSKYLNENQLLIANNNTNYDDSIFKNAQVYLNANNNFILFEHIDIYNEALKRIHNYFELSYQDGNLIMNQTLDELYFDLLEEQKQIIENDTFFKFINS